MPFNTASVRGQYGFVFCFQTKINLLITCQSSVGDLPEQHRIDVNDRALGLFYT